jgi:GT2 family glycosyltransferase/SAM-dependent methyltransferase
MKHYLEQAGYILDEHSSVWRRKDYQGIAYSDGDEVEERLASIIAGAADLSVLSTELRGHCTDWPSLYHLSSTRANILRPLELTLQGKVLEIGAGCGAITRYLGEIGASVLALEGSPRRASIARSRTRDLHNVSVLSESFDSFDSFDPMNDFDAVTLIGVLEYANLFTQGKDAARRMLERAQSLLKADGKLIIAIENQLGLKYFAGAPEDHLGRPMYGIEGRYRADQPETFGRKVLTDLLISSGFRSVEVLAPFPDYKLPVSIVTEQGFATKPFDAGAFAWQSVRRDPQLPAILHFSPELTWPVVVQNGLGLDLANSFLVVASKSASGTITPGTLGWHFSTDRREEYCKKAEFIQNEHKSIEVHYTSLSRRSSPSEKLGLLSSNIPAKDVYQSGRSCSWDIIKILSSDGWTFAEIQSFLIRYFSILNIEAQKRGLAISFEDPASILPGDFIDFVPQNIVISEDSSAVIIDREWTCNDDLSLSFLVYRFLSAQLNSFSEFGQPGDNFDGSRRAFLFRVFDELGWQINDDIVRAYFQLEAKLQVFVTGHALEWSVYENWLNASISPRHAQERRLSEQREAAESILSDKVQLIASQHKSLELLRAELQELRERNALQEESLRETDRLNAERLIEKDRLLKAKSEEVEAVLSSTSWRATAPIRHLLTRFRPHRRIDAEASENNAASAFVVDARPIPIPGRAVFVLLPIYKDTQLTVECIKSALPGIKNVPNAKLLAINDCSPEPGMSDALIELEAANGGHMEVLTNPHNLGFVETVNRGLEIAKEADVVLLNSDVILPLDWLRRLRVEAYSHPKAGTVTPLSNNTTICTFPEFLQDNPLPLGLSADSIDNAFKGERLPNISAPTGIGFCMYIRQDCLEAVGHLDAEHFPRGYGEENDLCQRAISKGWLNLITPNLFAYHKGGVSFGAEKNELISNGLLALGKLHPRYHYDVQNFIQHDPLKAARLVRLMTLLEQQDVPKILHICHALGGGTRQHVAELAAHYKQGNRAFPIILEPTEVKDCYVLKFGTSETSDAIPFSLEENFDLIIDILRKIGVSFVHYHHILDIDEKVMDIAQQLGVDYYFTAHDYYMISGNPTLTDANGRFDPRNPYTSSNPLYAQIAADEIETFRTRNGKFLEKAARVIFPSAAAKEIFDGVFTLSNAVVAHHLEDARDVSAGPVQQTLTHNEVVVGVLGALSKEKGADLIESLARLANERNLPLRIKLIGYAYRPLEDVETTGPYQEPDTLDLLRREKIDILFYSARWPETYSYTLSSGLAANLPIMAPDVGAFPERLSGRTQTMLYSLDATPEDILDAMLTFCAKLKAGSAPTAPTWLGAVANKNFYDQLYLRLRTRTQGENYRSDLSVPRLVAKLLKDAPEVVGIGWPHSAWRILSRLYRVPGVLQLRDILPATSKERIRRIIIKRLRRMP